MKAILFDLDGTLLDTLDELEDAVNTSLARFGYPHRSREQVREFVGNGVANLMRRAVPADTPQEEYEACLAFMREYYTAHSGELAKPYPGIPELLDTLKKKGLALAVVTNKPDRPARRLVEQHFSGLFNAVVGECADRPRKPAPDMPAYALEQLGLGSGEAVYVGDSQVDIQTARNAGLKVVSVTWGFRDREELEQLQPDWLVVEPMELLKLL